MRSSRSFQQDNNFANLESEGKGLQFLPFRSLRLGRHFTLIAMLIIIVSLFSCKDNTGVYRGELTDCSKALSETYKENVNKLKSYVKQDDTEAYDVALAAKKDLQDKFQAFLDVKPSKRMKEKKEELKVAIEPVFASLDKVEAAIDVYKNSGEIEPYKKAFEENFKVMNEVVENINAITATMKETQE